MMGSSLLGGADLPSVEEREKFLKGVEIRAKYVGAIEVPVPKGRSRPSMSLVRNLSFTIF